MKNLRIEDSGRIIGKVRLGDGVYIAQGTVLRSEDDSIQIGNNSFVLENSVVIGTRENPVKVGEKTVFGHKCVVIGAEFGNLCEVGNSAIFLPGSKIGNMCIFGEGTIVTEDMVIPDNSVVLGRPARIIRKLSERDLEMIKFMRGNDISLSDYIENIIENNWGEMEMGKLYKHGDKYPTLAEGVRVADTAEITGDVVVGENSFIGSGVRIIGDSHGPIRIGKNVRILENTVLHLLPDNELTLHDNVVIGPNSMIHGTIIGEDSIVEAGAIICDNSRIGKNVLVKSGSLVNQRAEFDDNMIVEGFPAKVVGDNKEIQERPAWSIREINS